MPNLNIELSDEEHKRLDGLKEQHGLTWRGLLLQGEKKLQLGPPNGNVDLYHPVFHEGRRMAYESESGTVVYSGDWGRSWATGELPK